MAFILMFLGSAWTQEILKETDKWRLDQPAYAQMTIVPTYAGQPESHETGRGKREARDWDGPWEICQTFQICVGYSKGRQIKPKQFDFVQPMVELRGSFAHGSEAHSETVDLFEGPSAPGDIKVQVIPLQGALALNTSYKVAALSSERENLSWDVYVRFCDKKPDYIKAKE